MKCPDCGSKTETKIYQSIAFPKSKPFIRKHCTRCEWCGTPIISQKRLKKPDHDAAYDDKRQQEIEG